MNKRKNRDKNLLCSAQVYHDLHVFPSQIYTTLFESKQEFCIGMRTQIQNVRGITNVHFDKKLVILTSGVC